MSMLRRAVAGIVSRRWYGVQARAVDVHIPAAGVAAAGQTDGAGAAEGGTAKKKKKEDVFWMRNPKTGYWIPENRFDEVDAVQLRNQLLHRT